MVQVSYWQTLLHDMAKSASQLKELAPEIVAMFSQISKAEKAAAPKDLAEQLGVVAEKSHTFMLR